MPTKEHCVAASQ